MAIVVEEMSKRENTKTHPGIFHSGAILGIMATDTVKTPLLAETIEPDDPTPVVHGNIGSTPATTNKVAPVVLTPTNNTTSNANSTPAQLEAGELDSLRPRSLC